VNGQLSIKFYSQLTIAIDKKSCIELPNVYECDLPTGRQAQQKLNSISKVDKINKINKK